MNAPAPWSELEQMLPPAPVPVGSYVPVVRTGNLLFTSGVLPMKEGQLAYTGPVGSYTVSLEDGQEAARLCALNALSIVRAEIGDFVRLIRVVKLTGYVSSTPSFTEQPAVINGASDLLAQFFGEQGRHARAAVGVAALPLGASVELDLIVEAH